MNGTTDKHVEAVNLHPIFSACCAQEPSRYAIDRPWLGDDGYVYATDGNLCVLVPARSAVPR